MAVSFPAVVVLIVCKTVLAGPADQNSDKTGWENRSWEYKNSMMVCQRREVQMTDPAEDQGAQPQGFNTQRCWASAIFLGAQFDMSHRTSAYRTWRVACPVPMFNDVTGDGPSPDDPIVGYVLPDCGHRDTVICETDSVI